MAKGNVFLLFSSNAHIPVKSTTSHELYYTAKAAIEAALESPAKYHSIVEAETYPLIPYQRVELVAVVANGELNVEPGRLNG